MSEQYRCPICKSELVSSRQQLRSDDEPTALVRACPRHGQVGTTIHRYLNLPITHALPTISPRMCTRRDIGFMPENEGPWYPSGMIGEYKHAYVRLSYPIGPGSVASQCKYAASRCMVLGRRYASHRHTFHPFWNEIVRTGHPCHVIELHRDVRWMYGERLIMIVQGDNETPDHRDTMATVVMAEHPMMLQNGHRVMATRDGYGDSQVVTVHCVTPAHDGDFTNMHAAIRNYICDWITEKYSIVGCVPGPSWISEARRIRFQSNEITCPVPEDSIGTELMGPGGDLIPIRASGVYGYMYVDRHYAVSVTVGQSVTAHLYAHSYPGTPAGPVLAVGYHDIAHSRFSATRIVRTACSSGSSIHTVSDMVRALPYVTDSSTSYESEWRECRYRPMPNIVLVSSKRSDDRLNVMSLVKEVTDKLMCKLVTLFMTEASCTTLLIYGRPDRRLMSLVRSFKCCFVYESNWERDDDESIADVFPVGTTKYDTISEALESAVQMVPSTVERSDSPVSVANTMMLGLDQIDYSTVDARSNYVLYLPHGADRSMLPSRSMLSSNVECLVYESGSLVNRLATMLDSSLLGNTETEYLDIYCSAQAYPYVMSVYSR